MTKNWFRVVLTNGAVLSSHSTREAAEREAARLAAKFPGLRLVVA
jgi:hypothetical protein